MKESQTQKMLSLANQLREKEIKRRRQLLLLWVARAMAFALLVAFVVWRISK